MRVFLFIAFLAFSSFLKGQSFILNQFFQPSISVNGEYTHDYSSDGDRWSMGRLNANLIIPIKSKLGVQMNWKKLLNINKLGDLKDVARLKAYQIFWTLRPQVIHLQYQPLDPKRSPFTKPSTQSYGLQTGITGLHLIKKVRLFFYTINLGVQEEVQSYTQLRPYANAIFGVVNFNRIFYYWYYGVFISASEGQVFPVLPIPFIGVDLHLAKKFWWNITLPIQTRFEWKFNRYTKLDAIASLGTYGWGFGESTLHRTNRRLYASGIQFRTGLALNLKNKRGTKLYIEAGYMPFRSFDFHLQSNTNSWEKPVLGPAPYIGFSMFYGFKRSLLGSTVENFLNF